MEDLSLSKAEIELFLKIIKFYSEAKVIIAYSEEVDIESKYNIQVWKELRDAFDHLLRAFVNISVENKNNTRKTVFRNILYALIGALITALLSWLI